MNCEKVHKNLIFFIEKELSTTQMLEMEDHISQCSNCNYLYNELRNTMDLIHIEKEEPINSFFYTRLQQRIADLEINKTVQVFKPALLRIFQPIAIVMLLGFGIFMGVIIGTRFIEETQTVQNEDTRLESLQTFADAYFLNEMEEESIETFYLNYEN